MPNITAPPNRSNDMNRSLVIVWLVMVSLAPTVASAASVCCSCKGPPDPTSIACLTGDPDKDKFSVADCATMVAAAKLPEGWTCEKDQLNESKCRSVSDGGVCQKPPTSMFTYAAPQGEPRVRQGATTVERVRPEKEALPTLNVAIPGLTFTGDAGLMFGEYVAGANRYLLSIVAVAATVMFIYGAFLYLIGTAIESIRSGKQIMTDAVVGMLLVLGAYLILSTINPATVSLNALTVTPVEPIPLDYMAGNRNAPGTLAEVGVLPGNACTRQMSDEKTNEQGEVIRAPQAAGGNRCATNLNIPVNCPTRGKGKYGIKGLTPEVLKKYLEEQSRTGIPAGVIIANMLTESWNSCIIANLFGDPTKCGKADYIKYYNYGGIGCPQKKGATTCAHQAFPQPLIKKNCAKDAALSKQYKGKPAEEWPSKCRNTKTTCEQVDFNKYSAACKAGCAAGPAGVQCGEGCYPQPSYAQFGGSPFPSVQCSRIFKNASDFLTAHLSFVNKCLPFNDSVYKFAYCIGVSTYAGAPEKGEILASIIEQNCLCGDNDSYSCKRDLELEKNVTKGVIRKKNLYKLATQDEVIRVFEGILQPSTGGESRTEESIEAAAEKSTSTVEQVVAPPPPKPPVSTTTQPFGTGLPPMPNAPIIPDLNVKIPGLTFGSDTGALLAQYISTAYIYLISVSTVIASIMFTFGAFLYLLGTAITQIQSGKRIMTDAVVGLLLVLGAHLILRTVNPSTIKLESLNIASVGIEYPAPTIEEQAAPGPQVVVPSGGAAPTGVNSPGCDTKGKRTLMIPFPFQPQAAPPNTWKPQWGNILISPGAIDCPGAYPFIYFFHGNTGDNPGKNGLVAQNGAVTSFKLVLNHDGPASKLPDHYPIIMVVPFSKGSSETLFQGFNFDELRSAVRNTLKANPATQGIEIASESVMGHSGAGCNSLAWGQEVTKQKLYMIGYADTCFARNGIDKNHAPEKIIADVSIMDNAPKGSGWEVFVKDHEMTIKNGNNCRLKYPSAVPIELCAEHPTKDWFFFKDKARNHGFPITLNLMFALENWFKK